MQSQSIKDQVYEGILNDILDGKYDVTSVIKEKDMIAKYQVSKTPVREALVQLCSESILVNIPRYGYKLVAITPQQILEVIEFRKVVEVGALTMCFDKITGEDIEQLRELIRKTSEVEGIHDHKIHWKYNMEFHKKLCGLCQNAYLQKALEDGMKVCTGISNQYYTHAWSKASAPEEDSSHAAIVNAIENKDLERAKHLLEVDIEAFKSEVL